MCIKSIASLFENRNKFFFALNICPDSRAQLQLKNTGKLHYHNSTIFFPTTSRLLSCRIRLRSNAIEKTFTNSLLYFKSVRSLVILIRKFPTVLFEVSLETDTIRFKFGKWIYIASLHLIYRILVPLISIKNVLVNEHLVSATRVLVSIRIFSFRQKW